LSIEDSEVVFVSERNNAGLMKLSSFVWTDKRLICLHKSHVSFEVCTQLWTAFFIFPTGLARVYSITILPQQLNLVTLSKYLLGMKTTVDGMWSRELGYTDQRFGRNCCLHLQDRRVNRKGDGAGSSEHLELIIFPEDGHSDCLRNVGNNLANYTASHRRRLWCSWGPPWWTGETEHGNTSCGLPRQSVTE
jgi:hypothetical protein